MAELIIQTGKHRGRKLVLSHAEIVLGRSPECHVRLAIGDVSKQHCALRATAEGLFARDLGSRNGTYVNDQPIDREVLLKPGDRLRIGAMELLVPQKQPARPRASGKSAPKSSAVSDDEIAHWLTDGHRAADPSADTTTIVSTDTALHTPGPPPAEPSAAPEPPQKHFKTIADEASDIISRWQEKQQRS